MQVDALESRGGNNPLLRSGIALGSITKVNPDKRFCEVRTFAGDTNLLDRNIPQCQWLSLDANPAGDEFTSIPREGAMGLVFIVGGEAFIFGYLKPTSHDKGARSGKEPSGLNEGDKCISTVGGNRVVIKASGVIEVYSSETLKTVYFPKGGILSDICEEHQMRCDGGFEHWRTTDDVTNFTLHTKEYRADLYRSSIIYEERGHIDSTVIKRVTMGPGLPGVDGVKIPLYEHTIDITGKVETKFGVGGILSYSLSPTGAAELKNKLGGVSLSETGDWEIKTPTVTVGLTADGDMSFKGPVGEASVTKDGTITAKNALATLSASKDGSLEFKGPMSKLSIDKAGKVALGSSAAEVLTLVDKMVGAVIEEPNLCITPAGNGILNPKILALLTQARTLLGTIKA
jgi:phage gp45-like